MPETKLPFIALLVFCLLIVPFTVSAKPDAPTGFKAEFVAVDGNPCIILAWNAVAGAKSYEIFRSASGSGDDFMKVAQVAKTTFKDHRVKPDSTYVYCVTAIGKSGTSDYSELAMTKTGEVIDTSRSMKSVKRMHDFMFDIAVNQANAVVFHYNFKTEELQYTRNGDHSTWLDWAAMGTLGLPHGFNPKRDRLIFTTDPGKVAAWIWNSASGATQVSYCNVNTNTFNPWKDFATLPNPPNWSDDTYMMADDTWSQTLFVAYNVKDGSTHVAKLIGNTWTGWEPFGTIAAPPNYVKGDTFVTVGIRETRQNAPKGDPKGGYYIYSYNAVKNTVMYATKDGQSFSWVLWQHLPQMFSLPPGYTN